MGYEQTRQESRAIEHVIYVHGLWMNGADGLILRRRLARDSGLKTHTFRYHSVSASMADVATQLGDYARRLGAQRLHFVAHSLGGLVVYRALERYADLPPGRVVFLGTPAVASRAALGVQERASWACRLMGRCVAEELLTEHSRTWALDRDLGIIAGTHKMGLGQYFAKLDDECDGTVCVSEARLPGARDFLTQPVSHMGLLMSAKVARQTGAFLRDGHFSVSETRTPAQV